MATATDAPSIGVSSAPGTDAWTNPDLVYTRGGGEADVSPIGASVTEFLKATGFDFSAIPEGATIDGISAICSCFQTPTNDSTIKTAQLVIGGTISGTNQAADEVIATGFSPVDITIGGALNKWGLTPTRAQVIASNFGVAFAVEVFGFTSVMIDYIEITVYYTAAAPGSLSSRSRKITPGTLPATFKVSAPVAEAD